MTLQIATNAGDGDTLPVQVQRGQYLLGVAGTFDSASVQLMVNIGNVAAPLTDAVYTGAGANVVWLPNCTVYITVSDGNGGESISAALAELSTALD